MTQTDGVSWFERWRDTTTSILEFVHKFGLSALIVAALTTVVTLIVWQRVERASYEVRIKGLQERFAVVQAEHEARIATLNEKIASLKQELQDITDIHHITIDFYESRIKDSAKLIVRSRVVGR